VTLIGYTMMCEQAGPKQLVRDVAFAEERLRLRGHQRPLLPVAGLTRPFPIRVERAGRGCPGDRRHSADDIRHLPDPALSPRRRRTEGGDHALLCDGRFTLGLEAGENLNEHIVGGGWPVAGVRHEMLEEAVEIIRALCAGGTVTYRGKHFDVESARVWDLPDTAPPIGIAVSGPGSCRLAGRHAEVMIATEPRAELGQMFDDAGGSGKPRIGQIALSYARIGRCRRRTARVRARSRTRRPG
jgi:Luciferase-like monooxygenase